LSGEKTPQILRSAQDDTVRKLRNSWLQFVRLS